LTPYPAFTNYPSHQWAAGWLGGRKGEIMQTVAVTMSSRSLLKVGKFHLASVGRGPETQGLGAAFKPAHDALVAARAARELAEDALIEPRANARFAEAALEAVLRDVAAEAHSQDRKSSGELAFKAIFPNGLDAEVRPRGPGQLTVATALRSRLESQPAAAAVKAAKLKDLDAAMATLGSALETRRMAQQALGLARANEDGARETFVSSYDSNAGAIRQIFPRNRARQDLYFDQIRAEQAADDDQQETAGPSAGGDSKKT
jgi:hypothetical protein